MENSNKAEKILDISWKTIVKISVAIFTFYVVYAVKDILIWIIFALVISVLFDPVINFLQKRKIPRILGVIFTYIIFFGALSSIIYLLIPLLTYEVQEFIKSLPLYFEKLSPPLTGLGFQAFSDLENFMATFDKILKTMASNIFSALFVFFGGIFTTLFVLATAIFLSLEERFAEKTLMLIFPKKYEAQALDIWKRCEKKIAGWFGARILACLFVGVASYITFILFAVDYPFTLGLIAGVFNFVPYIGPFATAIILFLVVFPSEALKAVFVLVAFGLIQQIEGNVISPILMKKIVGLPPVLVLVSLVVGAKLWGVLGAILIIPLAGIIFEFAKQFLQKRKEKEAVVI